MPAWETNCLVDGEGGAADKTVSSGVVVLLKVGYPGVYCRVCGRWLVTAQRHGLRTSLDER